MNKQIMDNNSSDNQPDDTSKMHWSDVHAQGNKPASSLYLGGVEAAKLLIKPKSHWERHRTPDGITVPMIQDFLFEISDALIEGSNHAALSKLIARITTIDVATLPNTKFNIEEAAEAITTNAFPLLERIVILIESLRTEVWQLPRC